MLLLDTSSLIDALRLRQNRRSVLAELVKDRHRLATAAVDVSEVYAGMRPGEERKTETLLAQLEIYPLTASLARRAGLLRYANARMGRTFALADMMIAATALEYDLTIVTDNTKDFTLPGVKLYPLLSN